MIIPDDIPGETPGKAVGEGRMRAMLLNLFRGGNFFEELQSLLISLPVIILSLSFHEYGHAQMAYWCGDPTAKHKGRCTLNPLRHLDPVGFLMMLLVGLGYAKPVPVNPYNLRHGVRDDFLVSVAGVLCNLLLAVLSGAAIVIYYLGRVSGNPIAFAGWVSVAVDIAASLFSINIVLMVFNLLPVPPLDGYHVFNDLLFKGRLIPPQRATQVGFGLLMLLSVTGLLSKMMGFFVTGAFDLLYQLAFTIARAWGV